jgi:DNA-directed RNA polymerase subunit M/transcription elongation factor TFIIS
MIEEGTICLAKSCRNCNKKLIMKEDKIGTGNVCLKCRREYSNKYNKKRALTKKRFKRF